MLKLAATLILSSLALSIASASAQTGTIDSAYTDYNAEKDCKTVKEFGDEDAAELDCPGYKDYRIYVHYGDARESIDYGYPAKKLYWESFTAFNSAGPKIEWRLEDGKPFATIHRWNVSVSDSDGSETEQYLVVKKVGQSERPGGCVVGIIMASGNAKANEEARRMADEKARNASCRDEIIRQGGGASFSRTDIEN